MTPLIKATKLTKVFGDLTAVDGIDFEVAEGESFGFLGPNGAGKTSTMKMIGATSPISGGELSVLGLDPATDGPTLRSRLGVVPQENNLDEELSVQDNLMMYGRYFDMSRAEIRERIDELLEFVQLVEKRNAKIQTLSGGMKRRVVIARGLINEPDLFILDEPTTGPDPQARPALWDRLSRPNQRGVPHTPTPPSTAAPHAAIQDSLHRSAVGRTSRPRSALRRRPRHRPAMILKRRSRIR